ncbi:MAG: hypothetical protein QNJ29_10920 [Rhizobiaceae bacterium]|nr:hypothetical protein [Rhizobiaceae bacterium]
MKTPTKFAAIAALALAPAVSTGTAHAVSPNFTEAAISKINWDGFQACKALGNSGYTAVIRGIHNAASGGTYRNGGEARFNIRTCFETAQECERFSSRIHHKVANIEQVWLNRCSPRG